MIYTVTFNPSVDYTIFLSLFSRGTVNRAKGEEYYFGGKGINVSRVLYELGVNSTALGFVAGFTGEAIQNALENIGIKTDFIKLNNGISRINVKIVEENETEINGQGPNIDDASVEKLLKKIDCIKSGDTLVLAGSIPNTMPDNTYEKVLDRVKDKNIKIVVDAEKGLLLNSLKYKPFLVKPNRQELCNIFDVEIRTEKEVENCAKELKKLGAKNVIVSLDCDGAVLVDENGETHKTGILKGEVINTVGSGDSMIAGFIAGFEKENSYSYALKLGTVCANATAFSAGIATKEKINKLLKQVF